MNLTVFFAFVCIFGNVHSGKIKSPANHINGRVKRDVDEELSTKNQYLDIPQDLEETNSNISNLQNTLIHSTKTTVQQTSITECHSKIDDLMLKVLLLTSENAYLKKYIESNDAKGVDMEKYRSENKKDEAAQNSETKTLSQALNDKNNQLTDCQKSRSKTIEDKYLEIKTHASKITNLIEELAVQHSKSGILTKTSNDSNYQLIACQESGNKTIQDKDLQIKNQLIEITNLRKKLAVQNTTLHQLNECQVSKDRTNLEKDVEIKQSKTENEKLKTEQNSTLLKLDECQTSKNRTILEKDVEIENKSNEIYKLNRKLLAAEMNLTHEIQECMERGRSANRSKALYEAVLYGRAEEVQKMLIECEEPNAAALWTACSYNRTKIAALLIAFGANVNYEDNLAMTPLMTASYKDFLGIVKLLLAHGALVNHVDVGNRSASHWASSFGRVEPLKALIAAGADLHSKDVNRRTVLASAAIYDNHHREEEIVAMLKAAGAT